MSLNVSEQMKTYYFKVQEMVRDCLNEVKISDDERLTILYMFELMYEMVGIGGYEKEQCFK